MTPELLKLKISLGFPENSTPEQRKKLVLEFIDKLDTAYRAMGGSGLMVEPDTLTKEIS